MFSDSFTLKVGTMLKHSYNRIRHTSDPVSSPTLRFRMLTVPTYHPELPTPHPSKIITDDAAGITHSFYYYLNSTNKRASRASALRADIARGIPALPVTYPTGPTHWTRPLRPGS